MTQQTTKNIRTFLAAVTQLSEKEHTATFYLMNTSPNRNDWAVTDKALEEALPTLLGKPIGLGKGYKLGHFQPEDSIDAGTFISYEKPGSYAIGTAKYHDLTVWNMLKCGEGTAISTVIEVYREHCSLCGEDLQPLQEYWHDHECIKTGKAYSLVSSFKFIRFDHVDEPAYPQAGLLDMSAAVSNQEPPLTLYAEFYRNQGATKKPNEAEEPKLADPENQKIAALEESNKTLKAQLDEAVKKAEDLQKQLDAILQAQHDALVADTFTARKEAGLIDADENKERQLLAALPNEALQIMKADAVKTVQKLAAVQENSPKAKYAGDVTGEQVLAQLIEQRRAELGIGKQLVKEEA